MVATARPFLVQAKQPPHDIEAEMSVLGGLLIKNELFEVVAERICAEDFYRSDHQLLFRTIAEMVRSRQPCDFVTIQSKLRDLGRLEDAGGLEHLNRLVTDAYSIVNIAAYADVIRSRSGLRKLIELGSHIGDMGYRPEGRSFEECAEEAEKRLLELSRSPTVSDARTTGELCDEVEARISKLRARTAKYIGLPAGFAQLDGMTQGFEPGDLIIVAARPSLGKTSFACNIAEHLAVELKTPIAIFSMEMSGPQIMQRVLASYGRVPLQAIRSGRLDEQDFARQTTASAAIREAPLYVNETPALSPMALRTMARRLVTRRGVRLIIVDYIQLMRAEAENRANEVAEISRELKALAKELGVPIIALSQLNRAVEGRENKRPRLSDLRESGGIEQDADIVLFLYRDDYYNDQSKEKGKAEVGIAKQRNGPTGTVKLAWMGEYCKFDNLAPEYGS